MPTRTLVTAAPVPLTGTATFSGTVSAKLAGIAPIKATAEGVGEISGPALKVTFTIVNHSAKAIDLDSVTATLTDSTGAPTVSMIGSPAKPFSGSVGPGSTATGVYVFSVPTARRDPVTISLSYTTAAPVVLFVGNAQ